MIGGGAFHGYGCACGCGSCGGPRSSLGVPGVRLLAPPGWGMPGGVVLEEFPTGEHATMTGWGTEPLVPSSAPPTTYSIPDPGIMAQVKPGVTQTTSITTRTTTEPQIMGTVTSAGYSGWFTRDPGAQCARFREKLRAAKAGEGFMPNGLFGNRISVLQAHVTKWCGRAVEQEEAIAKADELYQQAVAAGDVVSAQAIEAAVDQQLAANEGVSPYAIGAVLLGLLGLGVVAFSGGGR